MATIAATFPVSVTIDRTRHGTYRAEILADGVACYIVESATLAGLARAVGRRLESPEPLRPVTRPVRIESDGSMFEMDGTPVICPGLEPEKVREGLAEAEAGLGRPLREVMAEKGPRCPTG